MILTNYMIADCDKIRSGTLQQKIDLYRSVSCNGNFTAERELLEKVWLEQPEIVLVSIGDKDLNAFSVLTRIKEVTPDIKVVFYSEQSEYAIDAYDKGADYFLLLPVNDIQIGKLVFRYLSRHIIKK